MGLFDSFKKKVNPEDIDYIALAEEAEKNNNYAEAIQQYEKLIEVIYRDKPESRFRHIRKKIVDCYLKLGDYEKVFDLWSSQYDPSDYGAKEMYDLIKILEAAQRTDLVVKVYDLAGSKLAANRIEFLIKQRKIPEANRLISELLASVPESSREIEALWLTKAKLSMSLMKWEEANYYLEKVLNKNQHNMEARKLKDFCVKQTRY